MNNDYQRARYVNPYTDFGFKKLFGTEMNKELLISFINSLFNGKEVVTDLTYLNTEHLGARELDRKAVFDVYCENEKGEKILVEMQKAEQQFFKDRSLYYATFPIREQAERGDWDYSLKAVYVIGILNFNIDDDNGSYFHHEDLHLPGDAQIQQDRRGTGRDVREMALRSAKPFTPAGTSAGTTGKGIHQTV